MSGTQIKMIKHKMRQEDKTHNDENNQLIETNPELKKILELVDENFKVVLTTVAHMFER